MAKEKADNMPRYSISLTKKNIEQLRTLQDELGFASLSETVRGCIHAMYSKTFPNYTRSGAVRTLDVSEPKSEKELAEDKVAKAKQRADTKKVLADQAKANEVAMCVSICENELGGVVGEDDKGNPSTCVFFQYDGRRRYVQELDVLSVTSDLVDNQYLPNKDRVLQLQADGNVDYDVNETVEDYLDAQEKANA